MDIKDLLKERHLTKATIADRLGVIRQNFNALLRNPTERTIERLARAIGCETWELLAPADVRHRVQYSQTCTCPQCGATLRITIATEEEGK